MNKDIDEMINALNLTQLRSLILKEIDVNKVYGPFFANSIYESFNSIIQSFECIKSYVRQYNRYNQ